MDNSPKIDGSELISVTSTKSKGFLEVNNALSEVSMDYAISLRPCTGRTMFSSSQKTESPLNESLSTDIDKAPSFSLATSSVLPHLNEHRRKRRFSDNQEDHSLLNSGIIDGE